LIFSDRDEGFWSALKKITETTKIPIVFTADSIEANTGTSFYITPLVITIFEQNYEKLIKGLNPDKNEEKIDEFDFKEKCIEFHISRPNAADAITMIKMIALDQGRLESGQ